MTESKEDAYLKKIGPRKLTDAENRQLHKIRLREGKDGVLGVLKKMAEKED